MFCIHTCDFPFTEPEHPTHNRTALLGTILIVRVSVMRMIPCGMLFVVGVTSTMFQARLLHILRATFYRLSAFAMCANDLLRAHIFPPIVLLDTKLLRFSIDIVKVGKAGLVKWRRLFWCM